MQKAINNSEFASLILSSDSSRRNQILEEYRELNMIFGPDDKNCCCKKKREIVIIKEGYSFDQNKVHQVYQDLPQRAQIVMQSSCFSSSCLQKEQQIFCQQVETYIPLYVIDNEYPEYLHQVPIKVHKDCLCQDSREDASSQNGNSVDKELFKRFATYDSIRQNLFSSNASTTQVENLSRYTSESDVNAFGHVLRNLQQAYGKAASKIKVYSNGTDSKGKEMKDFKDKFYDANSLILIATKLLNSNISFPDVKLETSTRNPNKDFSEESETVKIIMQTEKSRNSSEDVLFNNDEQSRSSWIFKDLDTISTVIGPSTDRYQDDKNQIWNTSSEVYESEKNNRGNYYTIKSTTKETSSFRNTETTKDFPKYSKTFKMNSDDIDLSVVTASTILYSKHGYKDSSVEGSSIIDENNLIATIRTQDISNGNISTKSNYFDEGKLTSPFQYLANNEFDFSFNKTTTQNDVIGSTISEKPEMYTTTTIKFNYSGKNQHGVDYKLNETDNFTLDSQSSIIYENTTNQDLDTYEKIEELNRSYSQFNDSLDRNRKLSTILEDHKDIVNSSDIDKLKSFNYRKDELEINDVIRNYQETSRNNAEMATATSIGYNSTFLELFTSNVAVSMASNINSTLTSNFIMTTENAIDKLKTNLNQINKNVGENDLIKEKWNNSTYTYFPEDNSGSDLKTSTEDAKKWTLKQEINKMISEDTIPFAQTQEKTTTAEYTEITQNIDKINKAITNEVMDTEDLHKLTTAKSTENRNDKAYSLNIKDSDIEYREVSTAISNLNKIATTADKDQVQITMFGLDVKGNDSSYKFDSEYSESAADTTTKMTDTSTTTATKNNLNIEENNDKMTFERKTDESRNIELTDKFGVKTSTKNRVSEPTYGTTAEQTEEENVTEYIEKIITKHKDLIFEITSNNWTSNYTDKQTPTQYISKLNATVIPDNTGTYKKITLPYFSDKIISSKYEGIESTFSYSDKSQSSIYFDDKSVLKNSIETSAPEHFNQTESLEYSYNQNKTKYSTKLTATGYSDIITSSPTHLDENITFNYNKLATNVNEKINNGTNVIISETDNATAKNIETKGYVETEVQEYPNKVTSPEDWEKAESLNYIDNKEIPGYFYTTGVSKFLERERASKSVDTASALEIAATTQEYSPAAETSTTASATALEYMGTTAATTRKFSYEQPDEKYLGKTTTQKYSDTTKAQEYSNETTTQKSADATTGHEFLERVVSLEYSKGIFHDSSDSEITHKYLDNRLTHEYSASGFTNEYSDSVVPYEYSDNGVTHEYSDSGVSQGYSDGFIASENSNNLFKTWNYTDNLKELNYSDSTWKTVRDYKDAKMTTLTSTDSSKFNKASNTNTLAIEYMEKDKLTSNFLHTDISSLYSADINATDFPDSILFTDYINNNQNNTDIMTLQTVYQKQISSSTPLDSKNLKKDQISLPIFSPTEAYIGTKELNITRNISKDTYIVPQINHSSDAKDSVHSLHNGDYTKHVVMQQPKDVSIKNVEIKHSFTRNFTADLDETKACTASFKEQCISCCECCSNNRGEANNVFRVKKQILTKDLKNYVNDFDYRPETFSFIKSLILDAHKDELEFLLSKAENLLVLENEILKRKISFLESMLDDKKKTIKHNSGYNLHKNSHMRNTFSYIIDIMLKPNFESRIQTQVDSIPKFLETVLKNDLNVSSITYYTVENLFRRNIISCHSNMLQQLASVIATSHVMAQHAAYETDQLLKALDEFLKSSNLAKMINYLQSVLTDTELEYINPVDAKQISVYIEFVTKILSLYHRDMQICSAKNLPGSHESIETTRKQPYDSNKFLNRNISTYNLVTEIVKKQVEETSDRQFHSITDEKYKNTFKNFTDSFIILNNTENVPVAFEKPLKVISSMSEFVDNFSTEVMTELSLYTDGERREKLLQETSSFSNIAHLRKNASRTTEMYKQTEPLFENIIFGDNTTTTYSDNTRVTNESATSYATNENLEGFYTFNTRSESTGTREYTNTPIFYESSTTTSSFVNDIHNGIDPDKRDETKYLTAETTINPSIDAQKIRVTANLNKSAEDSVIDESLVTDDIASLSSAITLFTFDNTVPFDTIINTENTTTTTTHEYKTDSSVITSDLIISKEIYTDAREDPVNAVTAHNRDKYTNQENLFTTNPLQRNAVSDSQTVPTFNITEKATSAVNGIPTHKYMPTEPTLTSLEDDIFHTASNHILREISFPQEPKNDTTLASKKEGRIQLENPPAQFQPINIDIGQVLRLIQNRELLKVGIRK